MDNRAPSMLKPTLIAGLTMGVVTSIPGLDVLNLCTCCSLVALGGFLGSFLYSRSCREANVGFRPGNGALVGLITGAFWAVAATIVGSLLFALIGNPVMKSLLETLLENPDLPPEALDAIEQALDEMEQRSLTLLKVVLSFFQSVIVGAIFATLGGLIGGAVFKVEPAPPVGDASPPPVQV